MKEIRMKKATRNQLPYLESNGTVELRYNKMAYGPKREASKNSWAGYRLQSENSDVCADEQSCESRHKNSLTVRAYFHTKVTKNHDGHNVTEICFFPQERRARARRKTKQTLCSFDHLAAEFCVRR